MLVCYPRKHATHTAHVSTAPTPPTLVRYTRRGVLVINTAQLHSTKPEYGFCTGSNPARGLLEIHDGEDLWRWSWLEIRVNAFRWSAIPQKHFIIIIIINASTPPKSPTVAQIARHFSIALDSVSHTLFFS